MLETAKRNLEAHFAWVGITERFDESLVLLGRTFGWRDVRYVSANVSRRGRGAADGVASSTSCGARTTSTSSSTSTPCRLLDERIAAEPEFADALERFRRANARYGRWGRLTYTLPSRIKRRLAPEVPPGG